MRDAALERVLRAVGADECGGHRRRADDLVRERLAARPGLAGEERKRRLGRVDAEVLDEQPLLDRALGAAARAVEQPAVERSRDGVAGIDAGCGDSAEPDESLRELEAREAGAVARTAAVDGDEDDAPVGKLADRRARRCVSRPGRS